MLDLGHRQSALSQRGRPTLGDVPKRRLVKVFLFAGALAVGEVATAGERTAIDACEVVPQTLLRDVGVSPARRPFEPEGGHRRASGCMYGTGEPSVHATVFALPEGGRTIVEGRREVFVDHGMEVQDLSGPGYEAWRSAGPSPNSESVVVWRGDRYLEFILFNAAPGAVEHLVEPLSEAL